MLLENELALCIADAFPVTPGHSLVIPQRHVADGLALHQPEWNAVVELLKRWREHMSHVVKRFIGAQVHRRSVPHNQCLPAQLDEDMGFK